MTRSQSLPSTRISAKPIPPPRGIIPDELNASGIWNILHFYSAYHRRVVHSVVMLFTPHSLAKPVPQRAPVSHAYPQSSSASLAIDQRDQEDCLGVECAGM